MSGNKCHTLFLRVATLSRVHVMDSFEEKCIFCKICTHKEPAELFYEDDEIVVFKDIKPASKHHFLVVPKSHIKAASHLTKSQKPLSRLRAGAAGKFQTIGRRIGARKRRGKCR